MLDVLNHCKKAHCFCQASHVYQCITPLSSGPFLVKTVYNALLHYTINQSSVHMCCKIYGNNHTGAKPVVVWFCMPI